ncbi:MAG: LicD family protein [Schaalia hyovaginalis]|uniref:Lipopolysaccharide cholinephosphotransferase n=1 Tax=Schaalia hyovaginalis TaxID=29316 RepID=A0A923E1K3_9ACTO|nr:LicD family protein [Schaalia hyovaginalis]MBB6334271.1 lipopolysaccharide cholinephosphotransferase [Schaalia hyovaginalis]MDY6213820.1 LicD family protein [Schaalia hyovaginalis]
MAELSEQEIKRVELGILTELDRVAREHGLDYVLAYGTLIGALRHRGFIPWDDDIDVLMPREDYERLYELAQSGVFSPRYKIATYRDESSIYGFFKLVDTRTRACESFIDEKHALGLWVDIFPLERVDITSPRLKRIKKKAYRLVSLRGYAASDPRFATSRIARVVKRLIHPITRRLDPFAIARSTDDLARSANLPVGSDDANTRRVLLVDDAMDRNIFTPDQLFPVRRCEFEGRRFPIPARAEELLENYYGDWRTIPAEQNRPPRHLRAVNWVDDFQEKTDG